MSTLLLRRLPAAFLFLWFQHSISAACVDSIRLDVQGVQCFGLRNGAISVDTVFGGEHPFYYSIDGQSFSTNKRFDLLWPGIYTFYVRDASGCVKEWEVTVPEPEPLEVKLFSDKDTVAEGSTVQLRAVVTPEGIPLSAIEWRPPDLFAQQDSLAQTAIVPSTTNFAIEVSTKDGCIARDQVRVEVEKTNVYFPNIIMPGSNQDAYFTMFAGEGVARIVALQVYSRGGGIVFERRDFPPNDPVKGWNGRWRGQPVQTGVYLWLAVVEYVSGEQKHFQGNVTVVN